MGITKIQVLKKRHFHLSALGIEAASFARLGLQTSDFGLRTMDYRFFLSEEKTKASKDIAESPTAIAGTPR